MEKTIKFRRYYKLGNGKYQLNFGHILGSVINFQIFCNHKISLFQVLDDSLIAFVGRVLCDTKMFTTDIRVTLLRLLAYGAIQDDFSIILHMDRKDHFIMNYAKDFESIPILEQEALALFVSIFSKTQNIKIVHNSCKVQRLNSTYFFI